MAESVDDFFVPSDVLVQKISEAQLQQAKVTRRWLLWTFTNRLDVTSTEAPASAHEPLSVPRARRAIQERLGRLLAALGQKARVRDIHYVFIASRNDLFQRFGHALAKDFGFDDTSVRVVWSAAFAVELRSWLNAFPNKRKTFGFGTLVVEDNGSIILLPGQRKS